MNASVPHNGIGQVTAPLARPQKIIRIDKLATVSQIIERHDLVVSASAIAVLNGLPVMPSDWETVPANFETMRAAWAEQCVTPDDLLVFVTLPQKGGAGQAFKMIAMLTLAVAAPWAAGAMGLTGIAAALFAGAIVAGGTLALNALFPPDTPKLAGLGGQQASPVYSLSGQSNAARLMEPVPCQYGRFKRFPDLAAKPYQEFAGNDQYLYQLLCEGVGKFEFHSISIEDTVIWTPGGGYTGNFEDVEIEIIEPGQTSSLYPSQVISSIEVAGQKVPDDQSWLGPFTLNASGTDANRLGFDILFPGGLFQQGSHGGVNNATCGVLAEYREIDDAGAPVGAWFTAFIETFTRATLNPQRISRFVDVSAGRYEARIRRTNDGQQEGDNTIRDAVHWPDGGARAYLVNETINADVTQIAIRMKANEQLSGVSSRKIKVDATRMVYVWTGTVWVLQASSSIAWAAYDLLTDTSYGAGITVSRLDFDALVSLDVTWTTRGDEFNGVFDAKETLWSALSAILRTGRAQPVLLGGNISFWRDEPQAVTRAVFTDRNIIRGTASIKHIHFDPETPDDVIVEYYDRDTWKPAEVRCTLPGSASQNPVRMALRGVTDRDHAAREGMFAASTNEKRRKFISFDTEHDGRPLRRGHLIAVDTDLLASSSSGSVKARSGLTLNLDIEPIFGAGQHYLMIRNRSGGKWGPVKIVAGASVDEVDLDAADLAIVEAADGPLDAALAEGTPGIAEDGDQEPSHFIFYEGANMHFSGLVMAAVPSGHNHVTIVAVADEISVHDAETGYVPPAAPVYELPTVPDAPEVSDLRLNRGQSAAEIMLHAGWRPAAGAFSYVAQISYDGLVWTQVYAGEATSFSTPVSLSAIWVRVAAIGVRQGPWISGTLGATSAEISADVITPGTSLAEVFGLITDDASVDGSIAQSRRMVSDAWAHIDETVELWPSAAALLDAHEARNEARSSVAYAYRQIDIITQHDFSQVVTTEEMVAALNSNTAAIAAESEVRADDDIALASDTTALGVRVDGNEADIFNISDAWADGDSALAEKISRLKVETAEQKNVWDAGRAILDAFDGRNESRSSLAFAERTLKAEIIDNEEAIASVELTLGARIDGNAAALQVEEIARADGDSALSSSIVTLTASTATNADAISQEQVDRETADAVNSAAVQAEQTARTDADSAGAEITSRLAAETAGQRNVWDAGRGILDAYASRNESRSGLALAEQTLRTETIKNEEAIASAELTLGARIDGNVAGLLVEQTARTDADSAMTSNITILQSNVAANDSDIAARATISQLDTTNTSVVAAQATADGAVSDAASAQGGANAAQATADGAVSVNTAQATSITQAQATADLGTASAMFKMEAVSAPSGVSARLAMFANAGTEGSPDWEQAGIYLDAMAGGGSRIFMMADQIVMGDDTAVIAPFTVEGGVVKISEMIFKKLTGASGNLVIDGDNDSLEITA